MSSLSNAVQNFTDLHDKFCEVCSVSGMIPIYVNLVDKLKDCIPDMLQHEVSP